MSFCRPIKIISTLLFCIILTACANMPQSLPTPTGRPEVVVKTTSITEVKNAITNMALNWGYYARNVSDYSAVYEKRDESIGAAMLLGSKYDSTPVWRITFNYVAVNGDVRVVANIHAVTNPGSAFERVMDLSTSSKDANSVQRALEQMRDWQGLKSLMSKRGKIGVELNEGHFVVNVVDGSPAQLAGIKAGDKLLTVDESPVTNVADTLLRVTGVPGTTVSLKIDRAGTVTSYSVVRGAP